MDKYRAQIKELLSGNKRLKCPKCDKPTLLYNIASWVCVCESCAFTIDDLPPPEYFFKLLDLRQAILDIDYIEEIMQEIEDEKDA